MFLKLNIKTDWSYILYVILLTGKTVFPLIYFSSLRGERKEFVDMNIFPVALAEEAADLSQALEGLTKEEAAGVGAVMGLTVGLLIAFLIVWYVFQAIADWKIFAKAGEPGWKSLIPI